MDPFSPPPPPTSQIQRSPFKAFGVIALEGVYILVLLVVILGIVLGVLTYFHKISLSNPFSHVMTAKITPPVPTEDLSLVLYPPTQKVTLINALGTLLQPQFLTSTPSAKPTNNKHPSMHWQQDNIDFNTDFNNSTPKTFGRVIIIMFPTTATSSSLLTTTSNIPLDAAKAELITEKYFQRNGQFTSWKCNQSKSNILCQQMTTTPDYKIGFGVMQNLALKGSLIPLNVYACLVPKSNPMYQGTQSCIINTNPSQ